MGGLLLFFPHYSNPQDISATIFLTFLPPSLVPPARRREGARGHTAQQCGLQRQLVDAAVRWQPGGWVFSGENPKKVGYNWDFMGRFSWFYTLLDHSRFPCISMGDFFCRTCLELDKSDGFTMIYPSIVAGWTGDWWSHTHETLGCLFADKLVYSCMAGDSCGSLIIPQDGGRLFWASAISMRGWLLSQ